MHAVFRHTPPAAPPRSRVDAVARAIGVEPERIAWRAVAANETVIAVTLLGDAMPEERARLAHVCTQLSGAGVRILPE